MLFISLVRGLQEAPEETVFVPATSDLINLDAEDAVDVHDRNLQSTCRTCNKAYLYDFDCGIATPFKNPVLHRNFLWQVEGYCMYSCCTDVMNDPNCCTATCAQTCTGAYIINGDCKAGYARKKGQWGSFEIGPNGPHGYRVAKNRIYTNPRCYHGCCSNTIDGSDGVCCVKI